jgi:hypothetical protein
MMAKIQKFGLEALLREQIRLQEQLHAEYPNIHLRFPQRVRKSDAHMMTVWANEAIVDVILYSDDTIYIPVAERMVFETGSTDIAGTVESATYGRIQDITPEISAALGHKNLSFAIRAYAGVEPKPEGFYSVIRLRNPYFERKTDAKKQQK